MGWEDDPSHEAGAPRGGWFFLEDGEDGGEDGFFAGFLGFGGDF